MINYLAEQEVRVLRQRMSIHMGRTEFYPEPGAYLDCVVKIVDFINSRGGSIAFAVERYKGDLEFFAADNGEEYGVIFLTKFAPHEIFFFGEDWSIGISSYPEHEYSGNLEYSVRLYGEAAVGIRFAS